MKFNMNGLIGYLRGKGWKVNVNEDADDEEVFEIEEEEDDEESEEEKKRKKKPVVATNASGSEEEERQYNISEEELESLRSVAQVLAKNSKLLEAFENGTLEKALSTVPAAAELVANAQARDKQEREQVTASIKANGSNTFTDEELAAMPVPALVKLNAQLHVSYAGMGGVAVQNAEQPLSIRPILLAPVEVKNG